MAILSQIHHQIFHRVHQSSNPQVDGPRAEDAEANPPRMVFLHGVMGFSANWRRIAKAFEDNFQVLVYDQRGHGRSFHPSLGYGAEDYADDLDNILTELAWPKIDALIGHSMGGRVAMHFAATRPEKVARLVIEDIGPAMYPARASLVMRMLDAVPVPFASKRAAKEWFDGEFLQIFQAERKPQELAQFLFANLTENQTGQAVWRFYAPGIRESVERGRAEEKWDEVSQLTMPTLVIRGELSNDLPRAIYQRMLSTNSHLRGVEIAGAGHWVHSEEPEKFIQAVQMFLNSQAVPKEL